MRSRPFDVALAASAMPESDPWVRRVREQTWNVEEIERLGTALIRLETTVHELADRHGKDAAERTVRAVVSR